jgi:hypothetical protein
MPRIYLHKQQAYNPGMANRALTVKFSKISKNKLNARASYGALMPMPTLIHFFKNNLIKCIHLKLTMYFVTYDKLLDHQFIFFLVCIIT